ncbi:MAG: hypothetical protein P8Y80_01985 [Acidobacteriota bacterium]
MDEARIPAWIKKLQQEHELADARRETARKQAVEDSLLLQREGPKFWDHLKKSLAIAVDSLPVLKLTGSISHFTEGIRIEVDFQHLIPVRTYTDISYDPGSAIVRCSTMNGGLCQLYLCMANNNEIVACSELDGPSMDPEQASEFIMRPMVDSVFIQK